MGRHRTIGVSGLIVSALIGCAEPRVSSDGETDASEATSESPTSTDGSEADADGSEDDDDDELKLDIGEVKLDMQPEPPDQFPVEPLGCADVVADGPLLEIDAAGAWIDDEGLIRVRLVDEGEEHHWDIPLEFALADALPADYAGVAFTGYLTEPSLWEWWHGPINGTVDLTLVSAEADGCLVAEIRASSNDWNQVAPPLGWLVTPLQPWP